MLHMVVVLDQYAVHNGGIRPTAQHQTDKSHAVFHVKTSKPHAVHNIGLTSNMLCTMSDWQVRCCAQCQTEKSDAVFNVKLTSHTLCTTLDCQAICCHNVRLTSNMLCKTTMSDWQIKRCVKPLCQTKKSHAVHTIRLACCALRQTNSDMLCAISDQQLHAVLNIRLTSHMLHITLGQQVTCWALCQINKSQPVHNVRATSHMLCVTSEWQVTCRAQWETNKLHAVCNVRPTNHMLCNMSNWQICCAWQQHQAEKLWAVCNHDIRSGHMLCMTTTWDWQVTSSVQPWRQTNKPHAVLNVKLKSHMPYSTSDWQVINCAQHQTDQSNAVLNLRPMKVKCCAQHWADESHVNAQQQTDKSHAVHNVRPTRNTAHDGVRPSSHVLCATMLSDKQVTCCVHINIRLTDHELCTTTPADQEVTCCSHQTNKSHTVCNIRVTSHMLRITSYRQVTNCAHQDQQVT